MKKIKIPFVIGAVATGILLLYLLLSAFGVTNSFMGWDARHSAWQWKLITIAALSVSTYLFVKMAQSKIPVEVGTIRWAVALLVVGFVGSTGFKGTAGDVKQVKTYLNMQGKVVDTAFLFSYYDNFYHFSTDPALKEYVIKYGELPGRNEWNYYIRAGKAPRSNAPRADEPTFQWHTGAYEMDLKQKNK